MKYTTIAMSMLLLYGCTPIRTNTARDYAVFKQKESIYRTLGFRNNLDALSKEIDLENKLSRGHW